MGDGTKAKTVSMTTVADVERLLHRARRFRDDIQEMRGTGASWEFTFPDGITERYTIKGLRPVEHLEDDVETLFVWAWTIKDYLTELARARGHKPQIIEDLVNRTPALLLVADVANRLKHSRPRGSRSGSFPRLDRPSYSLKHAALKSLTFSAAGVTVEPTDPGAVTVSYPVLDESGRIVADAVVLLNSAISYWENALTAL